MSWIHKFQDKTSTLNFLSSALRTLVSKLSYSRIDTDITKKCLDIMLISYWNQKTA